MAVGVLCTSILAAYYLFFVVERPRVFAGRQAVVPTSLFRRIWWTCWAWHPVLQFALHFWLSRNRYKNSPYATETLVVDGQPITVGVARPIGPAKAVLVLAHTLIGDLLDNVALARQMLARGWAVVSYSRRGHGIPLARPIFNTVGCQRTFRSVIAFAREQFPDSPLFAVGSSAGSSVVARYLGDTGADTMLAGAALVSPGYDFEAALMMPELPSRLCTRRLKNYFLWPNAELLQSHCMKTFEALASSRTVREWHDFQFRFAGHSDREAYMAEHNPAPVLARIRVPVLYLSAMDDLLFPGDLTRQFSTLADECDYATVVHTHRGGHISFLEGFFPSSWAEKITVEFLVSALGRWCHRRTATERPRLL